MIFLNPEFIYYLLPLLFILFGFLLTQKDAQEQFFSQEVMDKLRARSNNLTLKARNFLFFIVAILMILALANPVIQDKEIEVKAKSSDIMIALDISDSMLAQDLYPNRLKLAKQKGLELLKITPNERVGVIAFAKNSYLVSPLSFDSKAVSFLLSKLKTDSITEKGTDFLSLLDVVDNSTKTKSKKYLLIISDGGDKKDFTKEIESAKDKNIVVFILGIATKKGAPIKKENGEFIKYKGDIIITKLNENIIDLATKTGGVFIQSVNSDDDVKAMLKEITRVSDKKELKSEKIQQYTPLFYYPLGLAIFILLIAMSSFSKISKKSIIPIFGLFILLNNNIGLKARILDFAELNSAKEAYNSGDYETSSTIYSEYANRKNNPNSYFNAGNSLYKNGDYSGAIKNYEKAVFNDDSLSAKKYSNIGNAYAKQGDSKSLEKAIKFYEESLKLEDDSATKENLKKVKDEIKKRKEKEKKKNNKKEDSDDKDGEEKKDSNDSQKDSENKKNGKSKDSKDSQEKKENDKSKDSKDSKEKKENDKSKDSKDSKEKKENSKSKDSKDSKEKKENSKSDKSSEENNSSKQENDKQDLKNLDEDTNETSPSDTQKSQISKDGMSESEMKKWLNKLNKGQSSYMYQLNKNRNNEENLDEKPW